nr:fructosamine-3-kinase isoform X2 [Marmota flaviventris]
MPTKEEDPPFTPTHSRAARTRAGVSLHWDGWSWGPSGVGPAKGPSAASPLRSVALGALAWRPSPPGQLIRAGARSESAHRGAALSCCSRGTALAAPSVPAQPLSAPSRRCRPREPMEQLLRAELRTATLRAFGIPGAGCISEGRAYETDAGPVFVKVNRRTQARQMFEGEMASLEALRSTGLVRAPRPLKVIDLPAGGAVFVMEYLKMKSLSSQASKLGDQMADLHLYNQKLREKVKAEENTVGRRAEGAEPLYVTKFGFHTVTCCGFIPQVKIPDLFCGLEIVPALLHGDLWSGNVAEDDEGPIIYDPASFYGHSEFELAIALMFGGFPRSFFTAYHRKIPQAPGFDRRLLLYQLFNYLNHWNHFGREYRSPSLGTMRKLLK